MGDDAGIYDLGEVKLRDGTATLASRRRYGPNDSGRYYRGRSTQRGSSTGPGLAGSLSMFIPGAGQLLAGEPAHAVFFFATTGFAVATAYALIATLDRLLPTLDLLDVPRFTVAVAIVAAALAAISLHVWSVLHAHGLRDESLGNPPHPLVAGLASILVPGWGQVLVGHRARAGIFLASLWIVGAAWLAMTPTGTRLARELGFALPPSARDGWGPIALIAAPILLWALAVYDAAAGASSARR